MMKKIIFGMIVMILIVLLIPFITAPPPSPHGISGFIYYDGGSQVPLGTKYYINDTTSDYFVNRSTYFPIPGFSGYYSETISGNDNDNVTIRAWNDTYYGETFIVLIGDMSGVDVTLNLSRPSEPIVKITNPTNNSERNTSNIFEVNANITIFGGDGVDCNVTITFSNNTVVALTSGENATKSLGNISSGDTNITKWQVNGTWIGTTDVTVVAECSSDGIRFEKEDNTDTINNLTIKDTTPPIITLQGPANDTWNTTNNITFSYYVEEITGLNNCSIYLDDSLQQSELLPNTFETLNFSLPTIAEGVHNWSIKCYDTTDAYLEGNSETRVIKIDTIAPSIELIEPSNNTQRSNNTADLTYNVTEQTGNIENCTLILNSVVENISYNVTKSQPQTITRELVRGQYYWNVTCYDSADNMGFSGTDTFNITDPDLLINSENISFNPAQPIEGQTVELIANIYNIGDDAASDIIVQFFNEDPYLSGVQIGSNKTISSLGIQQNQTVSENWTAKMGFFNFFVIVDPPISTNGSIYESNESNNKANKTLFLPAWQTYYGNTTGKYTLKDSSDNFFVSWNSSQTINIFITETNTNLNWQQLQAIGRDTSNSSTFDDFEEADIELNMTSLIDSVNATYTIGGVPKLTRSFMIFDINISNVPIVNSTNTSDFVTGVLWDVGDGGLEYNGTQDIVFITESNQNTQGKYGVYDYEINVPAKLREYKLGSGSLTLYTELT